MLRVDARGGIGLLLSTPLPRRALAEYLGTALLVTVVVGSGIAAQRLSPDDVGLQLLENAAATAGGLVALILALGPVSGAHFNPVVSAVDAWFGGLDRRARHRGSRAADRTQRRPRPATAHCSSARGSRCRWRASRT